MNAKILTLSVMVWAALLLGGCPQTDLGQQFDSLDQTTHMDEPPKAEEPDSADQSSAPGATPGDSAQDASQDAPEVPASTVLLNGSTFGNGLVYIDPLGEPGDPMGFIYPPGSTITLVAEANPGWFFVGWGGDVESLEPTIQVTLTSDTYMVALFEQLAPPPTPEFFGAILVAADGTFLGNINNNPFDSDSLANSFGTYGNPFSSLSIWNQFATYGNPFSSYSPYNSFTSTPPEIYIDGLFYGYLTKNAFLPGVTVDPDALAAEIGRFDVLR
jgi:hypothetical protein